MKMGEQLFYYIPWLSPIADLYMFGKKVDSNTRDKIVDKVQIAIEKAIRFYMPIIHSVALQKFHDLYA